MNHFEESLRLMEWLEENRNSYSKIILNEFKPLVLSLEEYFYDYLTFHSSWIIEDVSEKSWDETINTLIAEMHHCSDRWSNMQLLNIKMHLQHLAVIDGYDWRTTKKWDRIHNNSLDNKKQSKYTTRNTPDRRMRRIKYVIV